MQDHRQLVSLRQFQLCAVKLLLGVPSGGCVDFGHKAIQANFPHRHQARIVCVCQQGLVEFIQVCHSCLRGEQRVNAQRIGVSVGMGLCTYGVEIGSFDSRDDAAAHALRTGVLSHMWAVGLKFSRIQVAVGVDPKHDT
jgi:hypothetical protein